METEKLIGIIIALIMAGISWAVITKREEQFDDPNDDCVVHLDELEGVCTLQSSGKYLVRTLRQSGNLQKDDKTFGDQYAAIKFAVSTFKRAKIECAYITKNTETEFLFRRPYHHHGGSAEGKKVGSIEIYKVE